MVMPLLLEELFATGVALEEDEGGFTVASQPAVQMQYVWLSSTMSGCWTLD
jgi:hypothetical protein